MGNDNWIAIYAAIVATGALALEIRRWFESGPRIKVRVQSNMAIAGDDRLKDKRFVVVTVRNRGTVATTITSTGFIKYPNRLYRWLGAKGDHFVVPRPYLEGTPSTLPYVLEPGTQWLGFINKDGRHISDFEDGTVVICVFTSDRDKPQRVGIPKNKTLEATDISRD